MMMRRIALSLVWLPFLWLTSSASNDGDHKSKLLASQCSNFEGSIQNLGSFERFYAAYSDLNERLHRPKPTDEDRATETTCEQNGLLYSLVAPLGKLVERLGKHINICTIEYASKLYHLHSQLIRFAVTQGYGKQDEKLMRILALLANLVVDRCKRSLLDRLKDVEERAPDALKHINLIAGLLNIGHDKLMKIPVQVEHYVPLLESERQPMAELKPARTSKWYEFKLTQQMRISLDGAKISCRALKQYHVNILGSLGLLASVGYSGFSGGAHELSPVDNRIKLWLITAQLCQTLRNVVKMSSLDLEGKATNQLVVSESQESDVSISSEEDTSFADFRLPELKEPVDLDKVSVAGSGCNNNKAKLNMRRIQLALGPNYRLANAIYSYLDLGQQQSRLKIAYDILGLEMPHLGESDDDDDEDEE